MNHWTRPDPSARILYEAGPGIAITLSSEAAPECRDQDRAVTPCATVLPVMVRHSGRLGFQGRAVACSHAA